MEIRLLSIGNFNVERLNSRDWSLIARYLNDEASGADLDELTELMNIHLGLRDEIRKMCLQLRSVRDFDTETAFAKLHTRFSDDKLI